MTQTHQDQGKQDDVTGPLTDQVAIVVPCLNEEAVIETFYRRVGDVMRQLRPLRYQLIFVDDGSTDQTLPILNAIATQDDTVRVYAFSRNFGHQIALTAGLDQAGDSAVIFMDSDLQHPPELIPELVRRWQQGADIVSTVRTRTEGASALKRLTSNIFYRLMKRMSDVDIVPGAADFCLLAPKAADALRRMPERHRLLRGMISWIGFNREFVPFVAPQREAGVSKYNWKRMVAFAGDAIFSFATTPVKLIVRAGLWVTGLSALAILGHLTLAVGNHFPLDPMPVLGELVLLSAGLQLTAIGVCGHYVARILEEAKGRPLYLFKQMPGGTDG